MSIGSAELDDEARSPTTAYKGGRFLARVYAIERQAQREALTGDALLTRRQAQIRPVAYAFRLWLDRQTVPADGFADAERLRYSTFGRGARDVEVAERETGKTAGCARSRSSGGFRPAVTLQGAQSLVRSWGEVGSIEEGDRARARQAVARMKEWVGRLEQELGGSDPG
jgi:hypothetical protein